MKVRTTLRLSNVNLDTGLLDMTIDLGPNLVGFLIRSFTVVTKVTALCPDNRYQKESVPLLLYCTRNEKRSVFYE